MYLRSISHKINYYMKYNHILILLLLSLAFARSPTSVREIFNKRNRNTELLEKIKEYQ